MRNDFSSNYLSHHGILGQKWGIRNYQNPDGSLTPAGRERYGVGVGKGVEDISTEKGKKNRIKDLKKAIKINEKKRGKEYSKIANNPENFLGLNKKHAKKISEYSDNIKKGEDEIKNLLKKGEASKSIDGADIDRLAREAAQKAGLDQGDNWKVYRDAQAGDKKSQAIIKKWESDKARAGFHDENNEYHKVISEKRMDDGFGKLPSEWKDVYSETEAKDISFSIQALGKEANDVQFRIHNYDTGISNSEAAKASKEFLDVFDDAKARKAIADEYYPYAKEQFPNLTKGQFENGIEAYSADTYPKWGTYEVHYDDGGYLGGHSLDIEGDMKTGKIKYRSMNG